MRELAEKAKAIDKRIVCLEVQKEQLKRFGQKTEELDREICKEIDSLIDTRRQIKKAVSSVADLTERTVLEYHFLCGMSMEQIAEKMNYSVRHIYRIYNSGSESLPPLPNKYIYN